MNPYGHKRPGIIKNFLERHLKPRPVADISICTGCAECKEVCPTKALNLFAAIPHNVVLRPKTGEPRFRPEIELHKCTRCYRCMEHCPLGAFSIFTPRLAKLFRR